MTLVSIALALLWGVVVFNYFRSRRQAHDEAWSAAAHALDGHFDPTAGPWYGRRRHIDATHNGSAVRLDHYTTQVGNTPVTYTRARSRVEFVASSFRLRVYPKGVLSKMGEALGTQDIKTGDAAFDDAFMVKSNDPVRARAWLSAGARDAMRRVGEYHLTLEHGVLSAVVARFETDHQALVDLARATADFAGRGRELRAFWTEVAHARGGSVDEVGEGRLRIVLDERAVPLRIETGVDPRGKTEVVARRLSRRGGRFRVSWAGGASDVEGDEPELVRAVVEGHRSSRRVAPGWRLEADDEEIRLVGDDLEGDPAQLEEAIALVEALAEADSLGAYR